LIALALLASAALPISAQTGPPSKYAKKLAPFVTSPQRVVDRMLEMAAPKPTEIVYDLGCGDARVLITAAQRFNARAVGIELDEKLVARATERIAQMSLQDRVTIVQGDLLQADLSGADVVILYLLTLSNEQLRPRLEKMLRPGSRVVSYSYTIPGWKPAKVDKTDEQHGHMIYLYEMPPAKQ
jgi:protein-L-isoaspartate O-methyltransferase